MPDIKEFIYACYAPSKEVAMSSLALLGDALQSVKFSDTIVAENGVFLTFTLCRNVLVEPLLINDVMLHSLYPVIPIRRKTIRISDSGDMSVGIPPADWMISGDVDCYTQDEWRACLVPTFEPFATGRLRIAFE